MKQQKLNDGSYLITITVKGITTISKCQDQTMVNKFIAWCINN